MSDKLGRTFSDLIAENEVDMNENEEIIEIDMTSIHPNPDQPRTIFDEESLQELANSIREHGVFQPIILKPAGDHYILVAGERRVKAAKMAGLIKIPSIIRDYNSIYLSELAILENLQREDLTPIEEAIAFQKALFNLEITHEELAKKIGKSRTYVTNMLGLLNLPASVIEDVNLSRISMGHARALSKLKNQSKIIELRDRIVKENLTVRDIEGIIRNMAKNKPQFVIPIEKIEKAQEKLNNYIDETINFRFRKNKLTFTFESNEELKKIIDFLTKENK